MITVHGMSASGNCYKVRLLLALQGRPYRWQETDLFAGANRTPEFLALNPGGKVPVLELEDGRCLCESDAILCYLAEGTPLLPDDAWQRAQVLSWLFFEQHNHAPNVAAARFILKFLPADHARRAELPRLQERGEQALAAMERQLSTQDFIAGDRVTIADIALFAYTHSAADGGFDLAARPALCRWLERMQATPGFVRQDAA